MEWKGKVWWDDLWRLPSQQWDMASLVTWPACKASRTIYQVTVAGIIEIWYITVNKTAIYKFDDMKGILISSSKHITKQHCSYLIVWQNELAELIIQIQTDKCNELNEAVTETKFTNLLDCQPHLFPRHVNIGNHHSSEVEINCKIAII